MFVSGKLNDLWHFSTDKMVGRKGRLPKDYIRLQGGGGYTKRLLDYKGVASSWFNYSIVKGSKKTKIFTGEHPSF